MTAPSLFEWLGGVSSIATVVDDFIDRIMVDDLGEALIGDFWLATDAYIYGYPLVTMEMTRRVFTNVVRPEGTHAPMGQLIKMREYPTPASIARRQQGVELCSRPDRQIHFDVAFVLAQRNPPINPRRFMETSGGGKAI